MHEDNIATSKQLSVFVIIDLELSVLQIFS